MNYSALIFFALNGSTFSFERFLFHLIDLVPNLIVNKEIVNQQNLSKKHFCEALRNDQFCLVFGGSDRLDCSWSKLNREINTRSLIHVPLGHQTGCYELLRDLTVFIINRFGPGFGSIRLRVLVKCGSVFRFLLKNWRRVDHLVLLVGKNDHFLPQHFSDQATRYCPRFNPCE